MTEQPRLNHLLDRLRRGVLLEAEAEALARLVGELEEEIVNAQQDVEHMKLLVAASSEPGQAVRMAVQYADRAIENGKRANTYRDAWHSARDRARKAKAEVARLTAGQCTHALAVPDRTTLPDLHHRFVEALNVAYPDPSFDAADLSHLVLAVRDQHVEQLEQQVATLRDALGAVTGQCRELEAELAAPPQPPTP